MAKKLFMLLGLCCILFTRTAISATCNIDFMPVMGNSVQNGTPTPETPVEIESVGTKFGDQYEISLNTGKNLFDIASSYNINASCSANTVTDSYPNTFGGKRYTYFFNVRPNTQYTYSCSSVGDRLVIFGLNKIVNPTTYTTTNKLSFDEIIYTGSSSTSYTFTTGPNTKMVAIYYSLNTTPTNIQIEEGSVATTYKPYSEPLPLIYVKEPLRKVGNYSDELRSDGTVIRRVGVKVLDGTEDWTSVSTTTYAFRLDIPNLLGGTTTFCTHYQPYQAAPSIVNTPDKHCKVHASTNNLFYIRDYSFENAAAFKSYLAQQYAAGTPVTVFYTLAEPSIEYWTCNTPVTDIKIATTKMVDDEFAAAEANLAATVQTIESIVSRTISQTGQIQVLQDTKQTRPDESCPANKKCLLVEDEQGIPHWYEIIEP